MDGDGDDDGGGGDDDNAFEPSRLVTVMPMLLLLDAVDQCVAAGQQDGVEAEGLVSRRVTGGSGALTANIACAHVRTYLVPALRRYCIDLRPDAGGRPWASGKDMRPSKRAR